MFVVTNDGKIGIGTSTPAEELSVNGNIRAKQVKVEITNWPDYVFKTNYRSKPIEKVEKYIAKNGHLPEVPSAEDISKEGLNVGDMNKLMLKKIEELTLYVIEQNKRIAKLEASVKTKANKKRLTSHNGRKFTATTLF